MGYNHNRIKENARLFYRNNAGSSILSLLIFLGVSMGASILLSIILTILGFIFGGVSFFAAMEDEMAASAAGFGALYILFMLCCGAVSLGLLPLNIGLFGWYSKSIYQKTSLGEMFAPYTNGRLWSSIGTVFLMQLYTFLWSLLFVIPGIIKSYSYCQTCFIKAENPNISAKRAIELSTIMMEGHKGDLFYLHLSFFGWMFLSGLTYHILGIVYVFPYFYSALSFAYLEVKAEAIAKGLIDASEFECEQGKYITE